MHTDQMFLNDQFYLTYAVCWIIPFFERNVLRRSVQSARKIGIISWHFINVFNNV